MLNNMGIRGDTFAEGGSTVLEQSVNFGETSHLLIGLYVFDLSLSPDGSVLEF